MNERCQVTLLTLQRAVQEAEARRCAGFVVLGDLFDTPRPLPQITTGVRCALSQPTNYLKDYTVMLGNHERVSDTRGDHALGPLDDPAYVVDQDEVRQLDDVRIGLAAFRRGPAAQHLQEFAKANNCDILCFHYGIVDDKTAPWLQDAEDAVTVDAVREAMTACGARWCFAGNYHDPRRWRFDDNDGTVREIVQVGTLCPTGFSDLGVKGSMAVLDTYTKQLDKIEIPGPQFVKTPSTTEYMQQVHARRLGDAVYLQADAGTREDLEALKAKGWIIEGEIEDSAAQDAALLEQDAAAQAAGAAPDLEGAVVGYVEELDLEDDRRRRVTERSLTYLQQARNG